MNIKIKYILAAAAGALLLGCRAKNDYPGLEYAPNMYHSVAYEPLTQITDEDAGGWVSSDDDPYGEYYNSNPYNPFRMNMRTPPPHTVRRTKNGFLPYRIPKDSIDFASKYLLNPLDSTAEVLTQGQVLFKIYCTSCHGEKGLGDGKVGQVIKGVPPYNLGRVKDLSEGYIFHTITHGIRRMGGHGSQIAEEDRWKIVRYVQVLQRQQ